MALRTDDIDIRDVRMFVETHGNGDYYLNLVEMQKDIFNRKGEKEKGNVVTSMRVSMSGGYATHRVRMAIVELYRAMEEAKMNDNPTHEDEYNRYG